MRTDRVVVLDAFLGQVFRVPDAVKEMLVQRLVPQTAVEALRKSVPGFPGRIEWCVVLLS